jgi:hypothetical protein
MDHDRKWPFTVDLPINNGDFPLLFVRLPEGQSMKVWGEFFTNHHGGGTMKKG